MKRAFICICVLLSVVAKSQIDSNQPKQIPLLVIEAPRLTPVEFMKTGRNIMLMRKNSIDRIPSTDLNTTLDYFPGVFTQDRGPQVQSDLIIDGSNFEQTMLLINGVKNTDVQTGHNMLSSPIPFSAIRQITVTKGAASPRYGVGGLAGMVNLSIRPLDVDTTYIMATLGSDFRTDSSSSATHATAQLMGNLNFGGEKHRHLLSFELDYTNGYRPNTASQGYKLAYAGDYQIDPNSSLDILVATSNSTFGAPYFYAPPYDAESEEEVQKTLFQATLNSKMGNWDSRINVYNNNGFDHYVLVQTEPSIYQNFHQTNTFGIENNVFRPNRAGEVGLGLEFRRESIQSTNLGTHNRKYLGAFIEQKFANIHRFALTTSLYLALNQLNGFQLFPGLDMNYQLPHDQYLFASIRRGLRNPSFTDMYYEDQANLGNPNLVAENGYTFNIGYRREGKKYYMNIAPYARMVSNFITWIDTDTSTSNYYWQPQNVSEVGNYGVSALCTFYGIGIGEKTRLAWSIAYNYNNITDDLSFSKTQIQVLKHQFITGLKFSLSKNKINSNLTYRFQEQLDGYSYGLLDLRISSQLADHFRLFLDVNNILDEEYTSLLIPMPGRFFKIGFVKN